MDRHIDGLSSRPTFDCHGRERVAAVGSDGEFRRQPLRNEYGLLAVCVLPEGADQRHCLRLMGQRQERGGHEEPGGQTARREGADAHTSRLPRFGSLARGLVASGVSTRVTLSAWVHSERPSASVRKTLLF